MSAMWTHFGYKDCSYKTHSAHAQSPLSQSLMWVRLEINLYNIHVLIVLFQGLLSKPEDFNKYVTRNEAGVPMCGICQGFVNRAIVNVVNHIESKHFPSTFTYSCPNCHKMVATRKALQRHLQKCEISDVWSRKCFMLWISEEAWLAFPGVIKKPEDFDSFIRLNEYGVPSCGVCYAFSHSAKSNVRNHIESKHFPNTFTYSCANCAKILASKKSLQNHASKCKLTRQ